MIQSDNVLRAKELEAYEAIPSLDAHGEVARLILAEVSLLAEKYRNVRRHDVPHIHAYSRHVGERTSVRQRDLRSRQRERT